MSPGPSGTTSVLPRLIRSPSGVMWVNSEGAPGKPCSTAPRGKYGTVAIAGGDHRVGRENFDLEFGRHAAAGPA